MRNYSILMSKPTQNIEDINQDFVNEWTMTYTTTTLAYVVLSNLGKPVKMNITPEEALETISELLITTKETFPVFFHYFYEVCICLYSRNSVDWAITYKLPLNIHDIKTDETQFQFVYNCCLYYVINTLGHYLSLKNEKGEIISLHDLDEKEIPIMFEMYTLVLSNASFSESLFNLYSLLSKKNSFIGFMNFLKIFLIKRGKKRFKKWPTLNKESYFNDVFIKYIKEPKNTKSLNIFCKDLIIFLEINQIQTYENCLKSIKGTSFKDEQKQDLTKILANEIEIENNLLSGFNFSKEENIEDFKHQITDLSEKLAKQIKKTH